MALGWGIATTWEVELERLRPAVRPGTSNWMGMSATLIGKPAWVRLVYGAFFFEVQMFPNEEIGEEPSGCGIGNTRGDAVETGGDGVGSAVVFRPVMLTLPKIVTSPCATMCGQGTR